jgi:hypothetical protein
MWHKVKIKNKFNVFKIACCRKLDAGGYKRSEGRGKVALKKIHLAAITGKLPRPPLCTPLS